MRRLHSLGLLYHTRKLFVVYGKILSLVDVTSGSIEQKQLDCFQGKKGNENLSMHLINLLENITSGLKIICYRSESFMPASYCYGEKCCGGDAKWEYICL